MANPLPGNPHAEPANYADIDSGPYTKAQAMLALAWEQRTANLIALLRPIKTDGSGEIVPEEPFAVAILEQISKRMGIE
jgi:hypothetical protein